MEELDQLRSALKTRDGAPLRNDPVIRQTDRASSVTDSSRWRASWACASSPSRSMRGGSPPTCEASAVQALRNRALQAPDREHASLDIAGPGLDSSASTPRSAPDARVARRSTYRYTVIDTIGGGSSEIQKNILARRKLGLPKEFLRRPRAADNAPPTTTALPLGGVTVLDFSSGRSGRPLLAHPRRLRRDRRSRSAPPPQQEPGSRSSRRSSVYSAHRGMKRVLRST